MPANKKAWRFELWNGGALLQTVHVCGPEDAEAVFRGGLARLRADAAAGKCGAVTIAVHQSDDCCDHEQGGG